MTPHAADALARLGRLVAYPEDGYAADIDVLQSALQALDQDAARELAPFAAQLRELPIGEQQELFTRTFDLNPVCALEVGWHLYGEDYARGKFLVEMRQRLRAHGIHEGGELPDHLALLLALAAELRGDEADALVTGALAPAIDKMLPALEKAASPFLPLMRALRQVLAVSTGPTERFRPGDGGPPKPEAKAEAGPYTPAAVEASHG